MSFTIQSTKDAVSIHGEQPTSLRFTVTNSSERDLETAVQLHVSGAVEAAWCRLDPSDDTGVRARDSAVYELTVTPTGVVEPRSGLVWLEAAWVQRPNDVFTKGPQVAVTMVPRAESGWIERNWRWLATAAGIVLLGLLVWVLLPSGGFEMTLTASPRSGPPGTLVELAWTIDGEVDDAFLEFGGEELQIQPAQQRAGSRRVPLPAEVGPCVVELVASLSTGDTQSHEVERLSLTVEEPPPGATPPTIDVFTVTPTRTEAGKEVTFAWKISGDIGRAEIQVNPELELPLGTDVLAAGSLRLPFTAGSHRPTLRAFSTDLLSHDEKSVELEVTTTGPRVASFALSGAGRVKKSRFDRITRTTHSKVLATWEVTGDPKSLTLTIGDHSQPLKTNSGSVEVDLVAASGLVGKLTVQPREGRAFSVEAKLGGRVFWDERVKPIRAIEAVRMPSVLGR